MNRITRELIQEARSLGLLDVHISHGGCHQFLEATHPNTGRRVRVIISRGAKGNRHWNAARKKLADLRRAIELGGSATLWSPNQ